jgi:hypothetical protein
MMTIQQTVDIHADRRLYLELPETAPLGHAEIMITIRYTTPPADSGLVPQERFNAETEEAMREARDIMNGRIPSKGFSSVDAMFAAIDSENAALC